MKKNKVIVKKIFDINIVSTSHGEGEKRVLYSHNEFKSAMTQLACTKLPSGTIIGAHSHPTMDEHYIIQSGKGILKCENKLIELTNGVYVLIPAGITHELEIEEELTLLTIGIIVNHER